ncbi:MAG: hypothetical protein M1830_009083, partial [Pleopsidium flavum]
ATLDTASKRDAEVGIPSTSASSSYPLSPPNIVRQSPPGPDMDTAKLIGELDRVMMEIKSLIRKDEAVRLESETHWLPASITVNDLKPFGPGVCYSALTLRILMTTVQIPAAWILVPSDLENLTIPINHATTNVVFIRFRAGKQISSRTQSRYPGHWTTVHVEMNIAEWIVTCYDSIRGGEWIQHQGQACVGILKTFTGRRANVRIVEGKCPKQSDGYSCGPFAWQVAEALCRGNADNLSDHPLEIRLRPVKALRDKLTEIISQLDNTSSSALTKNKQPSSTQLDDPAGVPRTATRNKPTPSLKPAQKEPRNRIDFAGDDEAIEAVPSATSLGKRKAQDTSVEFGLNSSPFESLAKKQHIGFDVNRPYSILDSLTTPCLFDLSRWSPLVVNNVLGLGGARALHASIEAAGQLTTVTRVVQSIQKHMTKRDHNVASASTTSDIGLEQLAWAASDFGYQLSIVSEHEGICLVAQVLSSGKTAQDDLYILHHTDNGWSGLRQRTVHQPLEQGQSTAKVHNTRSRKRLRDLPKTRQSKISFDSKQPLGQGPSPDETPSKNASRTRVKSSTVPNSILLDTRNQTQEPLIEDSNTSIRPKRRTARPDYYKMVDLPPENSGSRDDAEMDIDIGGASTEYWEDLDDVWSQSHDVGQSSGLNLSAAKGGSTPPRTFICEFQGCTKAYATLKALSSHVKHVHVGDEPRGTQYGCNKCKVRFMLLGQLKAHILSEHGSLEAYGIFCTCGRLFLHRSQLQTHQQKRCPDNPLRPRREAPVGQRKKKIQIQFQSRSGPSNVEPEAMSQNLPRGPNITGALGRSNARLEIPSIDPMGEDGAEEGEAHTPVHENAAAMAISAETIPESTEDDFDREHETLTTMIDAIKKGGYDAVVKAAIRLRNDSYMGSHADRIFKPFQKRAGGTSVDTVMVCPGVEADPCPYRVRAQEIKDIQNVRPTGSGGDLTVSPYAACSLHLANCYIGEAMRNKKSLVDSATAERNTRLSLDSGPAANIETSDELLKYIRNTTIQLPFDWSNIRRILQSKGRHLYFIDTEFAGNLLCEVALVNTEGEIVLEAIIEHHKTPRQLMAGSKTKNFLLANVIAKFYGPAARRLPRVTMSDLADKLEEIGFGPETLLVEWSTSNCDWHQLNNGLRSIRRENLMPPVDRSLKTVPFLRNGIFKGLTTCSLPLLYPYLFPACDMASRSHYAGVDALKLWKVMKLVLDRGI